jgi:hypothetical protein
MPAKRAADGQGMVGPMGLLDDAIREHLELKRLRGADPSKVAREEQEALTPARASEGTGPLQDLDDPDASTTRGAPPPLDGTEPASQPDPPHMDQETAELDMRTVLHQTSIEHTSPPESDPATARQGRHPLRRTAATPLHAWVGRALGGEFFEEFRLDSEPS